MIKMMATRCEHGDGIRLCQQCHKLLHKAVSLTEEGDRYRAVTYNNFACIFRRTKKLRSALSYLEKALEIEYNYLHYSESAVDDCL